MSRAGHAAAAEVVKQIARAKIAPIAEPFMGFDGGAAMKDALELAFLEGVKWAAAQVRAAADGKS